MVYLVVERGAYDHSCFLALTTTIHLLIRLLEGNLTPVLMYKLQRQDGGNELHIVTIIFSRYEGNWR